MRSSWCHESNAHQTPCLPFVSLLVCLSLQNAVTFRMLRCPDTVSALPEHERRCTIFIAGGISNCPDWQASAGDELYARVEATCASSVQRLHSTEVVLVNPRRVEFDVSDPTASQFQIGWEHHHLTRADAILFWFPCETLCPITLYELGAWSMHPSKPLFIGVHPGYARRLDVLEQTRLVRPHIRVVSTLTALWNQVAEFSLLLARHSSDS
jgi:Nucleoside 2-deoxyribosyltransferase like